MIRLTRMATGKYQAVVRVKGTTAKPISLTVERVMGRAIDPEYPSWIVYVTENSKRRAVTTEDGEELFNSLNRVRYRVNALFEPVPLTWRFRDDENP